MSTKAKKSFIYALFGLVASTFTLNFAAAQSVDVALASPVQIAGGSKAPMGWVQFCAANPQECATKPTKAVRVRLTAPRLAELERINRTVNMKIAPVTDAELYGVEERWTYPVDQGDCEDYVLLKRRMLMEAGWPRQALLITVVRDLKGDGHAVLTVVTDRGDFTLDNQVDDIKAWRATGYTFIKRQSQLDANLWVLLGDGVGPVGVAAAP